MNKVLLLLSNTSRSKAYIQKMLLNNLIPNHIVIMDSKSDLAFGQQTNDLDKKYSLEYGFNINESLETTLKNKKPYL